MDQPAPTPRPALDHFVVLCGMPRCGTRQFADFLNRHPRLCLQGEIRASLLAPMRALLDAGEAAYPTGYAANFYRQKRARGVIDLFGLLSKGKRTTKPAADIHGFKCPLIERQQAQITALVAPSFRALVWLHCIRNPADCWLSLKAMPWFADSLGQFVERYCASLDAARALAARQERQGLAVVTHALDLDDFIASADKGEWLGRHLFAPLGLAPDAATLAHFAATTDNRNATSRATGSPRATGLDPDDLAGFSAHAPRLEAAIKAYNDSFGTALCLRLAPAKALAA